MGGSIVLMQNEPFVISVSLLSSLCSHEIITKNLLIIHGIDWLSVWYSMTQYDSFYVKKHYEHVFSHWPGHSCLLWRVWITQRSLTQLLLCFKIIIEDSCPIDCDYLIRKRFRISFLFQPSQKYFWIHDQSLHHMIHQLPGTQWALILLVFSSSFSIWCTLL